MNECTVLELRDRLGQGPTQLIDVREAMEFAAGRIAGATLIPLSEVVARKGELDSSQETFLICRTGRRSAEAQQNLIAAGYTNVVNVTGGFEAWKNESLPFDRDDHAPWTIERQVRFTAGMLVLIGVLLSVVVHPYFITLSGLIGFGLAFTATIDWCGMGLLIAKMPWNRRAI